MPIYDLGSAQLSGKSGGNFWIAPNATVIGAVELGQDVGIWFGAVIRGDNECVVIGDGTNIQDNAVLHSDPGSPCVIGNFCTIGHAAIVHGCRLGDGSLIGMGATILNDADIGPGSLVGANALITEGKKFPPRSLIVGSPARAIKTLSDDAVEGILLTAHKYVANAKRYQAELLVRG